jgi:RHS repeat-associated protein
MKIDLWLNGLAATLLFAAALPACAAGPGDNLPSTSPSGELGRPQTTPAGATATFYYWDHLGTVRMTAGENPTAENVERHDYEPCGLEMLPATNQAGNTHQFTGHERDALGGAPGVAMDYMHFRYYGPNLGRFMRPDDGSDQNAADPQSWNLYTYVNNNPLTYVDANGKWKKPGHEYLIDKAFPGLSQPQKEILYKASAKVDLPTNQGAWSNHDHAMKFLGENSGKAKTAIKEHISDLESKAKKEQGETPAHASEIKANALETEGEGLHTVADRACPQHTGTDGSPRVWLGYPTDPVSLVGFALHSDIDPETLSPEALQNVIGPMRESFGKAFGPEALVEATKEKELEKVEKHE